jgi:eukaryotic-like serine/threonine-protein kinase
MVEAGDTLKGYKVIQDFTTIGGGLSRWTFAEKDGKVFFLKEFLAPKYPRDSSPGSEKVKAQRRKRCERFEHHHRTLKRAIDTSTGAGGNLVATIDFFRQGTTYYKVTEKVDVSSARPDDVSKLSIERRILILKTVAHSLMVLHQLNIVHGDLKPDNILIKQTKTGDYIAKLIDFDNSYFAKEPPEISDESDIVGDPVYYSPELGKYIKRDPSIEPTDLYLSSDIFTLGIIYSQYLTGSLPKFNSKCRYAWESANIGDQPSIYGVSLPETLKKLVDNMLDTDPKKRPHIRTVFQTLKNWDKIEKTEKSLDKSSESPTESRLKGKGLSRVAVRKTSKLPKTTLVSSEKPTSVSRLKGKILEKKK